MNLDSLKKLHLDRRLLRRKDWISPEELDAAVRDLPDAAAKATTLGEVEEAQKGRSGDGAAPAS